MSEKERGSSFFVVMLVVLVWVQILLAFWLMTPPRIETLDDGTRCARTYFGGIDCDWKPAPAEATP